MNKRNLQIFGWKAYRPERGHVIGIAALALVIFAAFWFMTHGNSGTSSLTTSAVIPLPVEQTQQTPTPQDSSQASSPETSQQPPVEQDKPFIEYGGKCASDVKKAEDDVSDVNAYINEYRQSYDALKAEHDAKIAEIEKQYSTQFENANNRIQQAEKDLKAAQDNLNTVKAICTP